MKSHPGVFPQWEQRWLSEYLTGSFSNASRRLLFRLIGCLSISLLLVTQAAYATPIGISINTSGLPGQSGLLVFDLFDSSSASSSLTINNFAGNYTPDGAPILTGDASGSVAAGFSLADSQFWNEVAVPVQFNNSIGFTLDFSFGIPGPLEFPDELSIYLLTSDFLASLVSTDDPQLADSILSYYVDANGAPNLRAYDAVDGSMTITATSSTIPEPPSLALMIVPLMGLLIDRYRARKLACLKN